jgi:hypothetical protein
MKTKFISLVLTIIFFVSCSKSYEEEHELEFITLKFQESQSFIKDKKLHYEPANDTIINATNISLKDIINVIEMFYQSENNAEKMVFKNAKSTKINLIVVKNDLSIPSKEAFDELIEFLKQKKLVDY